MKLVHLTIPRFLHHQLKLLPTYLIASAVLFNPITSKIAAVARSVTPTVSRIAKAAAANSGPLPSGSTNLSGLSKQ